MPEMKTLTVNGVTYDIRDSSAVPATRTVNSKPLDADISLTAADVGARADTWMPTAADVGATPVGYGIGASSVSTGYKELNRTQIDETRPSGIYFFMDDENPIYTDGVAQSGGRGLIIHLQHNEDLTKAAKQIFVPYRKAFVNPSSSTSADSYSILVRTRHISTIGGHWTEWEWVNPPMMLGTEYRTTERYNGKPVYTQVVSLGALASSTTINLAVNIENLEKVISLTGEWGGSTLPVNTADNNQVWIQWRTDKIVIRTVGSWASGTGSATLKYTKTTD